MEKDKLILDLLDTIEENLENKTVQEVEAIKKQIENIFKPVKVTINEALGSIIH